MRKYGRKYVREQVVLCKGHEKENASIGYVFCYGRVAAVGVGGRIRRGGYNDGGGVAFEDPYTP